MSYSRKNDIAYVPQHKKTRNMLYLATRLWQGGLSFNIMVGIFMLAIPVLAHVTISNLLMPLVDVRGTFASIFFTIWICAVLLYAAVVSIGMWRTNPPARTVAKTYLPKTIAGAFFLLSLLYALYLFCSWIYLGML